MAHLTLQGHQIIETLSDLPTIGTMAPDFTLTTLDLSEKSLSDYLGQRVILNIFPSVDTETCSLSVKMFNKQVAELDNTAILCISRDLPFGQKRFCAAEGIENVHMLSEYKDSIFSDVYGVRMIAGPLSGLLSRAIVIIDTDGTVIYTEQVSEITAEPDYKRALTILD